MERQQPAKGLKPTAVADAVPSASTLPAASYVRLAAVALLALMALLAFGAARRESVTIDEVAHTAAGVSYLQKLDMRMNEEHPPLAKVLAAIPLVLRGAHADYSHTSWTFSDKIFNQLLGEWVFGHWFLMTWNDPHSTLFWARLPMLLLTVLLGLVIYECASRLSNAWGGLLSLVAYATMPVFLAFGPLVLTDVAVTLFWVLTVWQLPRMWQAPARNTVLKFGFSLAAALLSKFSAGLLLVTFPVFALSLRLWPVAEIPTDKAELRAWRRRGWRNVATATLLAALVVYLVYLTLSWNEPTDSFNVIPHFPSSAVLRRLLMPPWIFLRGLLAFALSAASRPTYILGRIYPHGMWFYFPLLFLLKSQLGFVLLLIITALLAIAMKLSRGRQFSALARDMELHWRSVWISLAVFVGACLLSRLNISIRHFSVALALTSLLLAPLPRLLQVLRQSSPRLSVATTWLAIALALGCTINEVRIYPYYFPYVNVLGMGRPGYALVNDSNLDWNQSLPEVGDFARRRAIDQVLLDEYGFTDTRPYIPQAQPWDCQQPAATDANRWAVISANFLGESGNCAWLLKYPHQVLAAGSVYAIHLPETIPGAGQPGGPPLPDAYRYFGGFPGFDVRSIFTTCIRDPQQLQPTMDWIKATGGKFGASPKK